MVTHEEFQKAYDGWYYTIEGAGGDIQEWKDGINKCLEAEGIGHVDTWFEFEGSDMNREYDLKGDNAYKDDLHFLAFPLDGLDTDKLAIFKLRHRNRWFTDIVDNNERNK